MSDAVLGIDEAGRGALIGPLCIGAVWVQEDNIETIGDWFREIGVRDSKKIAPGKRRKIADSTRDMEKTGNLKTLVVRISPEEIDNHPNLNTQEMEVMAKIMSAFFQKYWLANEIDYITAYIDCVGLVDTFVAGLKNSLTTREIEGFDIQAEHGMDESNIFVGAASIIAKEDREDSISVLRHQYGDFGSGYPSDPKTVAYLKENVLKDIPIFRKKWKNYQKEFENARSNTKV